MTIEHKIVPRTPDEVCKQCNQFFRGDCLAFQVPHSEYEEQSRRRGNFGMECDDDQLKAIRFKRFGVQYRTPPGQYVYTTDEAKNKAYVLKTDGTTVDLPTQPTLAEAQKAVGGYIEPMPTRLCRTPRLTVYANEEGRMQGLPVNRKATDLLGFTVVGDVLVLQGWKTTKAG